MPNKHPQWGTLKTNGLFPNRLSIGDICGDIWTLRVLEVACAGRHTLTLAGMGMGLRMAEDLGQWALRHGAVVRVVPTLPKHNYASAVSIYRGTRKFRQALQADVWVILPDESMQPNEDARRYVATSHLAAIEAYRLALPHVPVPTCVDFAPDSVERHLCDAARVSTPFFAQRFPQVLAVAATIAALSPDSNASGVVSSHISEAILYIPAYEFWPSEV